MVSNLIRIDTAGSAAALRGVTYYGFRYAG